MSFQPVLPMTGLAGWSFLNRTIERQQETFSQSVPVRRVTDHFRANIDKATSAEALVNDRHLLQVALGAFGLDDDINARAFIRKVLEQGTRSPEALSSRLSDKRYARLAEAFGYGDPGPQLDLSEFVDEIALRHGLPPPAVGKQDNEARLALGLQSALGDLLADTQSNRSRWSAIMDDPHLRKVFEVALELPQGLEKFDSEMQFEILTTSALATFGTEDLADFAQADLVEELAGRFVDRLAPRVGQSDFADRIIALYEARQFEGAIGQQDNDMRLALNLRSSLPELLARTRSDEGRWFALMGDPPTRRVFEVALGLPESFSQVDVDRQLVELMSRAKATFGTNDLADFAKDDLLEDLVRRFLIRSEAAAFANSVSPASIALTMLTTAGPTGVGLAGAGLAGAFGLTPFP